MKVRAHGWVAAQPIAPMVRHAGTPGMFWFILCTALKRDANSALRSEAKALDERKLGNVHGAMARRTVLKGKKRP